MPDYSQGKIYKIYPILEHDEGDIYIGSTTRMLSERMSRHRTDFRRGAFCKSKIIFEKYGLENCKIELIENFSCLNTEELNRKEGEHQLINKCVNKNIAGRTKAEWYLANRDKELSRIKKYSEEHKEQKQEYIKKWRIENREKMLKQMNEYRLKK